MMQFGQFALFLGLLGIFGPVQKLQWKYDVSLFEMLTLVKLPSRKLTHESVEFFDRTVDKLHD